MDFGIAFANVLGFGNPDGAVELAQAAEAAGFESLWTVEHVVVPDGYESRYPYAESGRMPGSDDVPIPDPLIWLTYVAAATTRIRLGTGILIVPQRNPVVLAKEVATLDHLSGGRAVLGVGAGWLEEEFDAIGVPFHERGAILDDHIGALRSLWSGAPASYKGTYSSFEQLWSRPAPVHGTVPIVVGGHSKAAARRAGRLGDGFWPAKGDFPGLVAEMRRSAEEAGRDPDSIELTAGGEGCVGGGALDAVKGLADQGVSRIVLPSFTFAFDPAGLVDSLRRYGDEVIGRT